ncbi:protein phosphatase 2C domain-containing protein [Saccharothrix variisporea]|uniref:Protein phosphatase 2C-like protein n=1 Tax=Saccharothrix variisporea TaxID=543527 RepID=A0A495XMZ7_9PSEU|nr:protein phosphatase 2C domain-containing protein [Saccharothrix variisporea]RKT75009.1 protein phosphatase 2C-like protein [Saccharothrix variisporea]
MIAFTLRAPKRGNTERECEDASRVRHEDGTVLAAVADGASESLLAGEWADLLTATLLDTALLDTAVDVVADADRFAAALVAAGRSWRVWLEDYVAGREEAGRPIAWYEQPKLDRGPHATVLAARFAEGRWDAAALGDSCLFHVREDRLECAFPLHSPADFDNSPPLVNAFTEDTALLARHVRTASGRTEPGDGFFLCTDAVAEWFLRETGRGGRPWRVLRGFGADHDGFTAWLDGVREEGLMRNDDVTVVHLDPG